MRIPIVLFTIMATGSTTFAEVEWHHGSECQFTPLCRPIQLPTDAPALDCPPVTSAVFDVDGATNKDSSLFVGLTCPVSWTGDASRVSSATTFTLQYRDHNELTTIAGTWCGPHFTDSNGNAYFGPGKYTCAANPTTGCASPDPGWVSPGGTTTALTFPGLDGTWRNVAIMCFVPAKSPTTGLYSSVLSYQAQF